MLPARQHLPERLGVVAHVEPVAHVHAVAVDRNRLAGQHALDHHRDQLLRELVRAVVVRAIGDDRGQAVGVMIGAHQHVARGLAGGVGRVRRVGRGFGEIAGRAEAAIDLVGGDVVEPAAGRPGCEPQTGAAGFQQVERADDVGVNEIARAGDGAVHVRFGRQVHDVVMACCRRPAARRPCRADPPSRKTYFGCFATPGQVLQVAGVGQAIQVDELLDLGPVDDVVDQVGADEAGAAGDEQIHEFRWSEVQSRTCRRLASQSGSRSPKVLLEFVAVQHRVSRPLARGGILGVVIGFHPRCTSGLPRASGSMIAEANPCQLVWPAAARW